MRDVYALLREEASYCVIDLETTGLAPDAYRVVECAVVSINSAGSIFDEWSTLITIPGLEEPGAQFIHHISRTMLEGAPAFEEIASDLVERVRGHVLVGHLLDFDVAHLRAELSRLGIILPDIRSTGLCTRDLAIAHLAPGPKTLGACCAQAGVELTDPHTALGDARATAQLFTRLLGKVDQRVLAWTHFRAQALHWPTLDAQEPTLRPRRASPQHACAGSVPR